MAIMKNDKGPIVVSKSVRSEVNAKNRQSPGFVPHHDDGERTKKLLGEIQSFMAAVGEKRLRRQSYRVEEAASRGAVSRLERPPAAARLMSKPLAIDLFCGLGGWTDGLLAEGYDVIGFDIERHKYGEHRYPAQLVIQDVLTLHGSQFKNATLIVASPPCQAYSYRAMPWKRAKALPPPDNTLFEACFRIQREACAAAGHHIPLVVENVRGAQKWVGRARWNFGSFYLWGDVPALMPSVLSRQQHAKVSGMNSWGNYGKPGYKAQAFNGTAAKRARDGFKQSGDWFNADQPFISRTTGSKSPARKAASAMIAKIPLPLSRHIAATFRP